MAAGFKVTLHHVAARANVSIATVSRALNGLPVGPEKLARVKKAVDDLGYVVNEAARSLRVERTMTVGMLFARIGGSLEFDLLDSLAGLLGAKGYSLLVSTARGDAAQYDLLMRRFLERRVDALICVSPSGEPEALSRYIAAGVPVFAMGVRSGAFTNLPAMQPSVVTAGREALELLTSLGHRRLGFLAATETLGGGLAALRTQAKSWGLEVQSPKLKDLDQIPAQLEAWMKAPDRPSVVFAPYREAVGLTLACEDLGVDIPRDLSIIAMMSQQNETLPARRPFTAITPHPERLSEAVCETLLTWWQGKAPPAEQRIETGVFTVRATTGPAPAP